MVIFCGSGSTAAIDKMIGLLNLRIPADLDDRYKLSSHIPPDERPVVFIGPFEHHSNELPWRESLCDVVTIPENQNGCIDLAVLEQQLAAVRRPPAAHRVVLRSIERHRHRDRHAHASPTCFTGTARCPSGTSQPPRPTSTST